MLWLSLDMHHWMLLGFERTYTYLPIGTAHLSQAFLPDIVGRTSGIFVIALQLAAPLLAVSFIISLVFSVLGRAVPQMNVFAESFAVRPLVGLSVFGLTLDLMSEHIINYLRHLPEDMLRVAQLLALTRHCHERTSRREDRETDSKAAGGCAQERPDRPQPRGADGVRPGRRAAGLEVHRRGDVAQHGRIARPRP